MVSSRLTAQSYGCLLKNKSQCAQWLLLPSTICRTGSGTSWPWAEFTWRQEKALSHLLGFYWWHKTILFLWEGSKRCCCFALNWPVQLCTRLPLWQDCRETELQCLYGGLKKQANECAACNVSAEPITGHSFSCPKIAFWSIWSRLALGKWKL